MLQGRNLKAVFALGAGVDSILSKLKAHPEMLPDAIPLYRLEDTGMGSQMQEYAVSQVLHWFRRFDDYQQLQREAGAGSRWLIITMMNSPLALWGRAYWDRKWHKVCWCAAGVAAVKIAAGHKLCWERSWRSFCGIHEC